MPNRNKYFYKLEMDKILTELLKYAITVPVITKINNLEPSNDEAYLSKELNDVFEASIIANRFERSPIYVSKDIDELLKFASKFGILQSIDIYEIYKIDLTIKGNQKLLNTLVREKIACNNFKNLVDEFIELPKLFNKIKQSIDYDGLVLDSASILLSQIRHRLKGIELRVKQKINEIMQKEASKLSEMLVVMRDNAYCLPVKLEYKNTFKGIIHDSSSSNQTFYIEPFEVYNIAKEKNSLLEQEEEEIKRILQELSSDIKNNYEALENNFKIIKRLDFIFAKALFANKIDARMPKITTTGNLNLVNAKHPFLNVKKVIPNNVRFTDDYQGIIITGPNTGGKTVLLKTVGLLSLMVKYGMLIPADENSTIKIFDNIYCDIGDDQSIEANLSTFSSHMSNIVNITNSLTNHSLVLFDEIGSGTDPIEGSSLALGVLEFLLAKKATFITTTHYSNLKTFGFNNNHVINAAMEFDDKSLSPTYKLLVGISGSSNAFNIAKKLGLKSEIISSANNYLRSNSDTNKISLEKLEKEQQKTLELNNKLRQKEETLNNLRKDYEQKLKIIDKEKENIIKDAKLEALKIIDDAKNTSKNLISELDELVKKDLKLHEVANIKHKLNNLDIEPNEVKKADINHVYHLGDDVYVAKFNQYGIIEKINGNKYDIAIGNMRMTFKKEDLAPTTQLDAKNSFTKRLTKSSNDFTKNLKSVNMTLDLRGKRYEEAKDELIKYIDDLIYTKIKSASIIHGYGTGAIRNLVQETVRKNKNIKEFRYGGEGEGGLGVTIITLK